MKLNPKDVSFILGKNIFYQYEPSGWRYETYIKNESTMEYRVHSGPMAGRWVKHQPMHLFQIADRVYRMSWAEPTGNNVSLTLNLKDFLLHGSIFLPRWVMDTPSKIAVFQNEALSAIKQYRDEGPTYPVEHLDMIATMIYMRDAGINNDTVIDCASEALPERYFERLPDANLIEVLQSA